MSYKDMARRLAALEEQAEQNAPREQPILPDAVVTYVTALGYALPSLDPTVMRGPVADEHFILQGVLGALPYGIDEEHPVFLRPLQRVALTQAYTALRWGLARRRRGDRQVALEVTASDDAEARERLGLDAETFAACWDDWWGDTWVTHWRSHMPADPDTLALLGIGPAELAFLAADDEPRFVADIGGTGPARYWIDGCEVSADEYARRVPDGPFYVDIGDDDEL